MSSKEPVTLSGWYELNDGRVQYFYWHHGQLMAGEVVESWADTRKRDPDTPYQKAPYRVALTNAQGVPLRVWLIEEIRGIPTMTDIEEEIIHYEEDGERA